MIAAVVQARCSSKRLPGKVLLPVAGEPMLWRQLERVQRVRGVDLIVATSAEPSDDAIAHLCSERGVRCHRGSLDDVLTRVRDAARSIGAEHVVRLTGDCPLSDPAVIERVLEAHLARSADYTSNALERTYPDGLDVEVIRFAALDRAAREAGAELEREHVTPYLYLRPGDFRIEHVRQERDLSHLRWVVDEFPDYNFVCAVFEHFATDVRDSASAASFGMDDIMELLAEAPEIAALNGSLDGSAAWPRSLVRVRPDAGTS